MARLEDPCGTLHEAGETGGDGRELFRERLGDIVREGQRHTVGGHHSRVRHVRYTDRKVADQPVQVLTVHVTQRSVPSPALGGWLSARRAPRWNPLRRLRAKSGDRCGSGAASVCASVPFPPSRLGKPLPPPDAPPPDAPPPLRTPGADPGMRFAFGTRSGRPADVWSP